MYGLSQSLTKPLFLLWREIDRFWIQERRLLHTW